MRSRPDRRLVPLAVSAALALLGAVLSPLAPPSAGSATATSPSVLPSEGFLLYDVRDGDNGTPIPCKLTFVGVKGTAPPAFTRFDIGRQEGDAVLAFNRIMSASGQGFAHVPAGTYDVFVSRGPEWEMVVARALAITAAAPAKLTAKLRHVVDTTGWISADFHVHAQMSSDSHVPMHDRIYEFLSDGVDVITSTDHNVVADYAPLIAELGAGRDLASIVGDEMTTGSWGHFGAFPLPQDLERAGHGAVLVHGRTPVDYFGDVRRFAPAAVIDVHHPRIDREIGYFNLAQFDSVTDRAGRPGFSFDFDAVEVLNGYQDPERRHIDRVIADWFNLLEHGHVVTATGNSDTHHLDHNIGGYPRNWVRMIDDRPSVMRPEQVAASLKGHHSFFSTAPFVVFQVDGAGIGGTVDARDGKVRVEAEVRAAPWVDVSTVTLYQSAREVKRWKVPADAATGKGGVRFRDSVDLPVAADSWLVLRVDGDRPLAPIVGDRTRFDVHPLAVTNPIFLDHDGNGVYDAPLKGAPAIRSTPPAAPPSEKHGR
jgi:hypothetical protein